jgi:uncharacterized membrane protein
MTARATYIAVGLLIIATFVATMFVYPDLPASVPTHWDIHNRVNGWSPKWMLFVLGPGMMLALSALFLALPWLSPKQFEVDSFRSTYLFIMLLVVTLMAYVQALILWVALGHAIDVGRAIMGGLCLMFALLGNVLGKVRRNFYIGIRTPWALANEQVWNATHRFAAKIFVAGGLLGLILTVIGIPGWPVIMLLLITPLIPIGYSLMLYKQMEHRGKL